MRILHTKFQELQAELDSLDAQIQGLRDQGIIPYPAPFVVDSSSRGDKTYYRRRDRRSDGKPGKAQMISKDSYQQLSEELERGRQVHRLEKQRRKIVAKMDAIALKASALGLAPPALAPPTEQSQPEEDATATTAPSPDGLSEGQRVSIEGQEFVVDAVGFRHVRLKSEGGDRFAYTFATGELKKLSRRAA